MTHQVIGGHGVGAGACTQACAVPKRGGLSEGHRGRQSPGAWAGRRAMTAEFPLMVGPGYAGVRGGAALEPDCLDLTPVYEMWCLEPGTCPLVSSPVKLGQ